MTLDHLLLQHHGLSAPMREAFRRDVYGGRRYAQYVGDQFWKRWVGEYLPLLHLCQKWLEPKRNIQVGDVVLVMDENLSRKS